MKILDREINAIIFDMDGTLIDSTGIWNKIDHDFFAKRGMEVPGDYTKEIVHLGLEGAAKLTKERYNLEGEPEDYIREWREASIYEYEHNIPLKEYGLEILNYFKANGVKLAIATANDEKLYRPCLKRLGIEDYFDVVCDVDNMKMSKSDPRIFETVSKMLNSDNEHTAVFEDSIMAIKTCFEAGFLTIAVDDIASRHHDEEKKKYSHLFIKSFKELIK